MFCSDPTHPIDTSLTEKLEELSESLSESQQLDTGKDLVTW